MRVVRQLFLGAAIFVSFTSFVSAQCYKAAGRVVSSTSTDLTLSISGQEYTLNFSNKDDGLRLPKHVFIEAKTFYDKETKQYFITKKGIDVPLRAMASSTAGLRPLGKIVSKTECLKN